MPHGGALTLCRLADLARSHGLNLIGAVTCEEFDRCQPKGRRFGELLPGCGTIVVMGNGGRALWERACAQYGASRDPLGGLHRCVEHAVAELASACRAQGWTCGTAYPEQKPHLDFMQLAEMAGLGTVSPVVHMLIHPEFGLWVRCRAALLLAGTPFGTLWSNPVPLSFQPCLGCPRPCAAACPAHVFDAEGKVLFARCADHRHRGGCAHACDARRACPIGNPDTAAAEEEAVRHAQCLAAMRRHFGLGPWCVVPRALRHRC